MGAIDAITEIPTVIKPPDIIKPTIIPPKPDVLTETIPLEIADLEKGLSGEIPPESAISHLAEGKPSIEKGTNPSKPEVTETSTSDNPAAETPSEDLTGMEELADEIDEEHDSEYPEPDGAEDPMEHFKWLKQKMNTMESSLIEKAVKKRLEKWDKKNPAPNVDDKDAHTKWLQDRSEAEEKFRDSYKRNSEKKENKKEKEGELNEAQILKLTTELRRKSQISADYAAAIEGYRSQPPTRENKMEIAKYQFAKQAIDQEIERINQLLTREVEKAPWMKKLRLMAIIAGAAVVYGTFKAAKSAEQPVQ